MSELASLLSVDPPNLTAVVDDLEARDWSNARPIPPTGG